MTVTEEFKNSFYDGIFANMFATLTGGLFLTGFAVYLGMNEFMIGILGPIAFMVTIFQLPTSYLLAEEQSLGSASGVLGSHDKQERTTISERHSN